MVLGDLLRAPLYCALDSTTWRSRFVQGGCGKELSVFADEDSHQMLNQGSAYEKETGKAGSATAQTQDAHSCRAPSPGSERGLSHHPEPGIDRAVPTNPLSMEEA